MGESAKNSNDPTPKVKHDWTFFFFIALTSLLIAAAIAWVSAKSGMLAGIGIENPIESAVVSQPIQ
jgi:hypothetical protein